MENLLQDLRYGIRVLLKSPGVSVMAILALALGIGANTAIFSVVNAVLLRALPFKNPDQLVAVNKVQTSEGLPGIAAFEYLAWRDQANNIADVAAYSNDNFNLTGQGEPERLSGSQVTANLFETLGVSALRGRTFISGEDQPGHEQVVLLSETFWQRRFSRNEQVI